MIVLIDLQILSTYPMRECMVTSVENLYVDIGT